MPSLSNIVKSTRDQASSNIKYTKQSVVSAPKELASSIRREAKTAGRDLVDSTVGAVQAKVTNGIRDGIQGISSAAGKAMHGDLKGAVNQLAKTFGIKLGSTLKGPNQSDSSGDNGITPGDSLSGALGRADPVLNFNWWAQMPVVQAIGGSPVELPWYYVEEATPPFITFETKSIFRNGKQKHYPGTYSLDSLRLSFYTDVDNVVADYLSAWTDSILRNPGSTNRETTSGMYGLPSGNVDGIGRGYKQNISIMIMSPNRKELVKLTYVGCWPQARDAYQLESNSGNRLITNVTFSVDDVIIRTRPVNGSVDIFQGPSTLVNSAAQAAFDRLGLSVNEIPSNPFFKL